MNAGHGPAPIERITARACRVPAGARESDGTLRWDRTTLVLVHAWAGGVISEGYGYSDAISRRLLRRRPRPRDHGL